MSNIRTIRGYEELIPIAKCFKVVIWGAGTYGRMLLQEIRVNNVKNVYIYDENSSKTGDITERILINDIEAAINNIIFVIAVADENALEEIKNKIIQYNGTKVVYRYIPKDWMYLIKILDEEGFDNGKRKSKPLDDLCAKELLRHMVKKEEPFLFSRWGGIEGNIVYSQLAGIFIESEIVTLKNNAGFYPLDKPSIHKFVECSINAADKIDMLLAGIWCGRVEELYRMYSPNAILVRDEIELPFWDDIPWTSALKGKSVLVIHPFAPLIEKQYMHRDKLFQISDVLPEMNLIAYQAVQSMNGSTEYASWFDALEKMKSDISKIDFDIALIGCGAYGMPLGAFIKAEMHKTAIHMGGCLQLFFGIKGKRWEHPSYGYNHKLYNEYWVRPTDDLKPQNYKSVENGCYW